MKKNDILSVLQVIGSLSEDGVLFFNARDNRIDYTNESLLKIFDISHESFSHQPAFFIHHIIDDDLEHVKLAYEKLLEERKVEGVEFIVKSHYGDQKYISANGYVFEDGKYIMGVFRDMTRRREHENYIINYGAKKNTLLDMVTHNLSGPLMMSKNILESLEGLLKEKDPKIVSYVQLIRENTRHCIDLLSEFLEEEHLVSEQIRVKKNRIDVVAKIETVLERFVKSYPDYEFKVIKDFDTLVVSCDDVKFLQVINNLISNAIKWSPTKSVIEIIVEETEKTFAVTVTDSGVGIPDEMKAFIFEKHGIASREGLRGEKSVGMGLYIVKKLVQLMGGVISFTSQENEGTSFVIELPKEDIKDEEVITSMRSERRN